MAIPFEKTLAEILRWRVNKDPNSIAHKFGERETTYREFDLFANKIAQGLIALDDIIPPSSVFNSDEKKYYNSNIPLGV